MPSPDGELPIAGPFLWEALTLGIPQLGGGRGEGPTGYLYLGGKGGGKRSDDNVYLNISTLLTERTLGFHVRFQPKREVGAENVGI
jgi:hypothetical protein